MFNAWAINAHNINGEGYIKSASSLTSDEQKHFETFMRQLVTYEEGDLSQYKNFTHEKIDFLFSALIKLDSIKSPADIDRWKASLNSLYNRLLEVLEKRVGEDPDYLEFMAEERQRSLGGYTEAHKSRMSLDVTNKDGQSLWQQTLNNPHIEMLIKMRQGTEILYAAILDVERQLFTLNENASSQRDQPSKDHSGLVLPAAHEDDELMAQPNPLFDFSPENNSK